MFRVLEKLNTFRGEEASLKGAARQQRFEEKLQLLKTEFAAHYRKHGKERDLVGNVREELLDGEEINSNWVRADALLRGQPIEARAARLQTQLDQKDSQHFADLLWTTPAHERQALVQAFVRQWGEAGNAVDPDLAQKTFLETMEDAELTGDKAGKPLFSEDQMREARALFATGAEADEEIAQAAVRRVHASIDRGVIRGWGKELDMPALRRAVEPLTDTQHARLGTLYKDLHGVAGSDDAKSVATYGQKREVDVLFQTRPSTPEAHQAREAARTASQLRQDKEDPAALRARLERMSAEQVRAVLTEDAGVKDAVLSQHEGDDADELKLLFERPQADDPTSAAWQAKYDAVRMHRALDGINDEDLLRTILGPKSQPEVQAMVLEYEPKYQEKLRPRLKGELGERDQHEIVDQMFDKGAIDKSNPVNSVREQIVRARELGQYEGDSDWTSFCQQLGRWDWGDDYETDHERFTRNLDGAETALNQYEDLLKQSQVAQGPEQQRLQQAALAQLAEAGRRAGFSEQDVHTLITSKESASVAAGTVGAVALTVVAVGALEFFTLGAATPLLATIAVGAGALGGAGGYALADSQASGDQIAREAGIGAVSGVTAMPFTRAGFQALRSGGGQALRANMQVGVINGATSSGAYSATDSHTWEHGVGNGAQIVLTNTALGAGTGALIAPGISLAGQSLRVFRRPPGEGGAGGINPAGGPDPLPPGPIIYPESLPPEHVPPHMLCVGVFDEEGKDLIGYTLLPKAQFEAAPDGDALATAFVSQTQAEVQTGPNAVASQNLAATDVAGNAQAAASESGSNITPLSSDALPPSGDPDAATHTQVISNNQAVLEDLRLPKTLVSARTEGEARVQLSFDYLARHLRIGEEVLIGQGPRANGLRSFSPYEYGSAPDIDLSPEHAILGRNRDGMYIVREGPAPVLLNGEQLPPGVQYSLLDDDVVAFTNDPDGVSVIVDYKNLNAQELVSQGMQEALAPHMRVPPSDHYFRVAVIEVPLNLPTFKPSQIQHNRPVSAFAVADHPNAEVVIFAHHFDDADSTGDNFLKNLQLAIEAVKQGEHFDFINLSVGSEVDLQYRLSHLGYFQPKPGHLPEIKAATHAELDDASNAIVAEIDRLNRISHAKSAISAGNSRDNALGIIPGVEVVAGSGVNGASLGLPPTPIFVTSRQAGSTLFGGININGHVAVLYDSWGLARPMLMTPSLAEPLGSRATRVLRGTSLAAPRVIDQTASEYARFASYYPLARESSRLVPGQSLTLGSGRRNLFQLSEPGVSPAHARITRLQGGKLLLEDMGSEEGTFVNNVRIPPEGVQLDPYRAYTLRFGSMARGEVIELPQIARRPQERTGPAERFFQTHPLRTLPEGESLRIGSDTRSEIFVPNANIKLNGQYIEVTRVENGGLVAQWVGTPNDRIARENTHVLRKQKRVPIYGHVALEPGDVLMVNGHELTLDASHFYPIAAVD